MPTKRRLIQLKSAKDLAIGVCKKRKFEASLVVNSYPEIEENKLNTVDTSNMEDKSKTWFWKNSANESDFDTEKAEYSDKNELDLEIEESREISPEVLKEIKWNKKGENRLCGVYGIRLKATSKRQQKSF